MHMRPAPRTIPTATRCTAIERDARGARPTRAGRKLTLVPVPSPGAVLDRAGEPIAASYMNFYLGNRTVIVPAFGTADRRARARARSRPRFPDRKRRAVQRARDPRGRRRHVPLHDPPAPAGDAAMSALQDRGDPVRDGRRRGRQHRPRRRARGRGGGARRAARAAARAVRVALLPGRARARRGRVRAGRAARRRAARCRRCACSRARTASCCR